MNQNHFSGGTSGSTPIVASTLTLVNDWLLNNGGKPLGFVTPLLYKMAAEQPNTLNDITSGNNTCTGWGREDPCCAGAGYQAYTGSVFRRLRVLQHCVACLLPIGLLLFLL